MLPATKGRLSRRWEGRNGSEVCVESQLSPSFAVKPFTLWLHVFLSGRDVFNSRC